MKSVPRQSTIRDADRGCGRGETRTPVTIWGKDGRILVADETRFIFGDESRLQVEHPVTELVTGSDLVLRTIHGRGGAPLGLIRRFWLVMPGVGYAEDPENNFFPSPGKISYLQIPFGPGIRNDSGVELNSEVSIYYDPLISKLAAWGRSRDEAIDRLRRALDEYEVGGIKTTLPFFREIVRDEEFESAKLDTGFIARFNERRTVTKDETSTEEVLRDIAVIAAAIHQAKLQREASFNGRSAEIENRWKISSRTALHEGRDASTLVASGGIECGPSRRA